MYVDKKKNNAMSLNQQTEKERENNYTDIYIERYIYVSGGKEYKKANTKKRACILVFTYVLHHYYYYYYLFTFPPSPFLIKYLHQIKNKNSTSTTTTTIFVSSIALY